MSTAPSVPPAPVIDLEKEEEIVNRYKGLLRSLRGERTSEDTRQELRKAFNIAVEAHRASGAEERRALHLSPDRRGPHLRGGDRVGTTSVVAALCATPSD